MGDFSNRCGINPAPICLYMNVISILMDLENAVSCAGFQNPAQLTRFQILRNLRVFPTPAQLTNDLIQRTNHFRWIHI